MNLTRKVVESATEALGLVLKFDYPADSVLSRYFQQHHALGQKDRAFVAEGIYAVLRHKRALDHLTVEASPRRLLLAGVTRFCGISLRELAAAVTPAEGEWLAGIKGAPLDKLPLAARAELPDWLYARLTTRLTDAEILALGRSMQDPAPLDLRVNTVRANRDEVLRTLAASNVTAQATTHSPIGVRVAGKPALNRHPLFLGGAVEVQDEGSQLIGYLVAPRRRDLVVDFCAGAGGKTLMLGAMMGSHGRVYAFDVSPARLARLKPRLKRSGLSNLHPHLIRNENDIKVKRLARKIDRVLVDAPCTGFGTLRRNPDLKWRQTPESVAELQVKQAAILRSASTLVKAGGRLVYATCSLLAEENEDVVEAFLAEHPDFSLRSSAEILGQHGIAIDAEPYLRLWPHIHGTDGFFAAALDRAV